SAAPAHLRRRFGTQPRGRVPDRDARQRAHAGAGALAGGKGHQGLGFLTRRRAGSSSGVLPAMACLLAKSGLPCKRRSRTFGAARTGGPRGGTAYFVLLPELEELGCSPLIVPLD